MPSATRSIKLTEQHLNRQRCVFDYELVACLLGLLKRLGAHVE